MESNWRKSSYSGDNGGACVEVACGRRRAGPRHHRPQRPVLAFTPDAWRSFTATDPVIDLEHVS